MRSAIFMMFSKATFRKACIFSAKGIAWLLYAAFLEYWIHSITMYFLRDSEDIDRNDTVFFTEKDNKCWPHICNRAPCGKGCSYTKIRKILAYMEKAQDSLDICIYFLTSIEFAWEIANAHKRGVKVRVITDGHRVNGSGSQIDFLVERGVPVCSVQTAREMHHKFFVVDKKILVNCSFNWTMQAVTGNSEDAIICSEARIVNKFVSHFDALWNTVSSSGSK